MFPEVVEDGSAGKWSSWVHPLDNSYFKGGEVSCILFAKPTEIVEVSDDS